MNNYSDLDPDSAVLVADLLYATSDLSAHIQQALTIDNAEGTKKLLADVASGKVEVVWFITASCIKLMAVNSEKTEPDLKIFELCLAGNAPAASGDDLNSCGHSDSIH